MLKAVLLLGLAVGLGEVRPEKISIVDDTSSGQANRAARLQIQPQRQVNQFSNLARNVLGLNNNRKKKNQAQKSNVKKTTAVWWAKGGGGKVKSKTEVAKTKVTKPQGVKTDGAKTEAPAAKPVVTAPPTKATTPAQPNLKCETTGGMNADTCCDQPTIFYIHDEILSACMEDDSEKGIYSISMPLIYDVNNKLNIHLPNMKEYLEPIFETAHCFFTKSDFASKTEPRALVFDRIEKYMQDKLIEYKAQASSDKVTEAAASCKSIITGGSIFTENMPDTLTIKGAKIFSAPFLYVQCIKHNMIRTCGTPASLAAYPAKMVNDCRADLEKLRGCDPFK